MEQPETANGLAIHGPPASDRAQWKRARLWLAAGLMCSFLAIWKGPGGYSDLGAYLDLGERIWLEGRLALPGTPDAPPRYIYFAPGLPFLSGPLFWLGAAAEELTGGTISRRSVAAFTVPCLGLLACILLFETGRILGFDARKCFWAALLLGLGSALLNYVRLYYAEIAVAAGLLLALWAFLRSQACVGRAGLAWLALSGLGIGAAAACHYGSAPAAVVLGLGLSLTLLLDPQTSLSARRQRVGAMALPVVVVLAVLMALNWRQWGHPLRTGYSQVFPPDRLPPFCVDYWARNLLPFARWLARTLWVVPALVGMAALLRIAGGSPSPGPLPSGARGNNSSFPPVALRNRRGLALSCWAAFAAGSWSWLSFRDLSAFPLRYPMPLIALAAPGLLCLGSVLARRWPKRALIYAGLVCCVWNFAFLLSGDDGARIVFTDPSLGPGLHCFVWYMAPSASRWAAFGTPVGAAQIAVWCALAGLSAACLRASARAARGEATVAERGEGS